MLHCELGQYEKAFADPYFGQAEQLGHPEAGRVLSDIQKQTERPQLSPEQLFDRFAKDVVYPSEGGDSLRTNIEIGYKMVLENMQSAVTLFEAAFAHIQKTGQMSTPSQFNYITLVLCAILHNATGSERYAAKIRLFEQSGLSI